MSLVIDIIRFFRFSILGSRVASGQSTTNVKRLAGDKSCRLRLKEVRCGSNIFQRANLQLMPAACPTSIDSRLVAR